VVSRAALLAAALAAAGCLDDNAAFNCAADNACNGGVCISGNCAKLDSGCPMGFRWDSSAGPRAGKCAEIPDMAVSVPDMIDPNCGNGVLDPGETCDNGPGSPLSCPPNDKACDDKEPCTTDVVMGAPCHQECFHSYMGFDDGVACPEPDGGTPGTCYSHVCCHGCWETPDGGSAHCSGGSAGTVCGHAGAACADCTTSGLDAGTPECLINSCSTMRQCAHDFVTDGTPCAGNTGACYGGQCCTGCIDMNGKCQKGMSGSACGSGGNACATCTCVNSLCMNCPHAQNCMGKTCGSDMCGGTCGSCDTDASQPKICVNNNCVCANNMENSDKLCSDKLDNDCNNLIDCADGGCKLMRCDAKPGSFCNNSVCMIGCRIAGAFYPAGMANPMNPCLICDPLREEEAWSNNDNAPCPGTNASPGTCHAGACCSTCWDANNNVCVKASSVVTCGAGGAKCTNCDDKNTCTTDACAAGKCTNMVLPDGTTCGSPNQCMSNCGCLLNVQCETSPTCKGGMCGAGPAAKGTCCTLGCSVTNGTLTCLL
jgi:hypothetical protein